MRTIAVLEALWHMLVTKQLCYCVKIFFRIFYVLRCIETNWSHALMYPRSLPFDTKSNQVLLSCFGLNCSCYPDWVVYRNIDDYILIVYPDWVVYRNIDDYFLIVYPDWVVYRNIDDYFLIVYPDWVVYRNIDDYFLIVYPDWVVYRNIDDYFLIFYWCLFILSLTRKVPS